MNRGKNTFLIWVYYINWEDSESFHGYLGWDGETYNLGGNIIADECLYDSQNDAETIAKAEVVRDEYRPKERWEKQNGRYRYEVKEYKEKK